MEILIKYNESSGQMLNLDKSEAPLSQNVHEGDKEFICNRMGVKTMMIHAKYLGLPIVFVRLKK